MTKALLQAFDNANAKLSHKEELVGPIYGRVYECLLILLQQITKHYQLRPNPETLEDTERIKFSYAALERECNQLRLTEASLNEQLGESHSEIGELRAVVNGLNSKLEHLRTVESDLEKMTEENAQLKHQLSELKQEYSNIKEGYQSVTDKLRETEANLAEQQGIVMNLTEFREKTLQLNDDYNNLKKMYDDVCYQLKLQKIRGRENSWSPEIKIEEMKNGNSARTTKAALEKVTDDATRKPSVQTPRKETLPINGQKQHSLTSEQRESLRQERVPGSPLKSPSIKKQELGPLQSTRTIEKIISRQTLAENLQEMTLPVRGMPDKSTKQLSPKRNYLSTKTASYQSLMASKSAKLMASLAPRPGSKSPDHAHHNTAEKQSKSPARTQNNHNLVSVQPAIKRDSLDATLTNPYISHFLVVQKGQSTNQPNWASLTSDNTNVVVSKFHKKAILESFVSDFFAEKVKFDFAYIKNAPYSGTTAEQFLYIFLKRQFGLDSLVMRFANDIVDATNALRDKSPQILAFYYVCL